MASALQPKRPLTDTIKGVNGSAELDNEQDIFYILYFSMEANKLI